MNDRYENARRAGGFTIVEMMVVIAIMVILIFLVIMNLLAVVLRSKFERKW